MARPLTREGVLPSLDDAVRLLRGAPLGTLVCHWMGSVPFALAVLHFWNDMTNPRAGDVTCALDALLLTLLLVWLHCWRAVFAGRLRRQLSGAPETPWTWRRVANVAAGQALWGASKLLMMPLALLIVFPLAGTVAFYRNLAVLGDRDDLSPMQLMARARQLAPFEAGQSWALLPLLAFLHLLLTVNLAIALGVLPQLARMLTGYETAFSRSGYYFVFNPLFLLLVIAVSWIAFDPFIQAVYCVRCFRAESRETGEDLRAGLGRIRGRMQAAALALAFLMLARLAPAAVTAHDLEQAVQAAAQSHEYDWRLPAATPAPAHESWLVRFIDRAIAGVKGVSGKVTDLVRDFFRWLRGPQAVLSKGGPAPANGLHWSLYVLTGGVLLIALVMVWRKREARRAKAEPAAAHAAAAIRLDAEDLTPDRLPEEEWLALAEQSLREQNFRLALRACYLANLAWLGRKELLSIHPGKTNHEYELELRRKSRSLPAIRSLFAGNVNAFERAWYGFHEVAAHDIAGFRSRVDQMKALAPSSEGVPA